MKVLKKYKYPLGTIILILTGLWTISYGTSFVQAPVFTPTSEEKHPYVESYGPPAPVRKKIGEHFNGEKLHYNLSFFLFFHAADADITFSKDSGVKNGYVAELTAKTTGVIKLLTFQRRDKYISHMVMMDDGKRLRSARFEQITLQGGKKPKHAETEFDYEKKTVHWKTWKGDEMTSEGTRDIPDNTVYDDILSAFFNFRYGVYGEIEKGKPIEVKAVPTKQEAKLELQVASEEETAKKMKLNSKNSQKEYLVKVLMDRNIFEQKKGDIEFWMSKDFVPLEGVVKGVLFLGDIHGVLSHSKQEGG